MEISTDPDQFLNLVDHLTKKMHEQLKPLLEERIICDLKIKQLKHKSKTGHDFAEQIGAIEAIQEGNERQIIEYLHSYSQEYLESPQ